MEDDIVTSLHNLGFTGKVKERCHLESVLDPKHPNSLVELSEVVNFLAKKLASFNHVEETVNTIEKPDEADMFTMELAGLLRELYCPYALLLEGPPAQRLVTRENRLKLINFLVTECLAAQMIQTNENSSLSKSDETPTAERLRSALVALGFGKPPEDITAQRLFDQVKLKVQEALPKLPAGYPGRPLLKATLADDDWSKMDKLLTELAKDYRLRREMLLTRLDVTVLSFTWSANVKNKLDEVSAIFQPIRSELHSEPNVSVCQLLSAREDIGFMEKTSSASVRAKTKTPLQRMVIGEVPDRGGRPTANRAPAPEMPKWQKRNPSVGQRGGGGGRGGGHRGGGGGRGRVQGGWNQGNGGSSWNQEQKPQWSGRRTR